MHTMTTPVIRKLWLAAMLIWLTGPLSAAGQQAWEMRVDGLACPYCAYGVEKKLKAIEGVEQVEVDLDKGLVKVRANEAVQLTEPQMETLFRDAGFTFRSMKKLELP